MPADLGSLWFRCDLRDRMMREVCFTGRYEPQETALLQLLLRSGMTFVDVGANWGYFSLAAARMVGPAGRVVSVEADPRACRTLRANVARNTLDAVAVVEMAASDRSGTLQLQEYEADASDSGSYGVTSTTTVVGGGRAFTVAARALDDVLDEAGVDRVDLLKMDIEGARSACAGRPAAPPRRSPDRSDPARGPSVPLARSRQLGGGGGGRASRPWIRDLHNRSFAVRGSTCRGGPPRCRGRPGAVDRREQPRSVAASVVRVS